MVLVVMRYEGQGEVSKWMLFQQALDLILGMSAYGSIEVREQGIESRLLIRHIRQKEEVHEQANH